MKIGRVLAALGVGILASMAPAPARAADVATIDGAPLRLDITETSLLSWHWDNRNYLTYDDNYGEWLNHFNVSLAWKQWQAGVRFDTATYAHTESMAGAPPQDRSILPYHFRDQYTVAPGVPSKMYLTYVSPDLEVTIGDSYVAFGRGLVLSIRKVDELAVDTSVQGVKVVGRLAPFTLTGVAGLSNPVRIDYASGGTLRDPDPNVVGGPRVEWTRDAIVGARAEAKIGTATVGVHGADVIRDRSGWPSPFNGYNWNTYPGGPYADTPTLKAKQIQSVGGSIAIPRLSDKIPLNIYAEWALQNRVSWEDVAAPESGARARGVAAYGALSYTAGSVSMTLEGKHYRGFYPVGANANTNYYSDFTKAVTYNAPPTVELITQDSLFDDSCTTGGRGRVDVQATKDYAMYASAAYFANWGEQPGLSTVCYQGGGFGLTHVYDPATDVQTAKPERNDIVDGYVGVQMSTPDRDATLLATAGARRDTKAQGAGPGEGDFYREDFLMFDAMKMLNADWSIELQGWHRKRYELDHGWFEGEDYLTFKRGSQQAYFIGHEYSSDPAKVKPYAFLATATMQHYLNAGAQFQFGEAWQVRLFVGQQRPALKCVAGACRFFPAFEGARAEVVYRY